MMNFNMTDKQESFREEIIQFSQNELNENIIERDKARIFPRELWLKCGELKLQGLPVPEEFGGSNLDPLSCALAMEAFGYGCHDTGFVFSVGAHLFACVVPIWKCGNEEQKRLYLPKLCDGSLIGANAFTEPDAGSDIASISTRATPVDNGFRINGAKTLITNAPVADLAIILAVTDEKKKMHGGMTAFLVERGTPGFTIKESFETMGNRTTPVGELVLEDVFVSRESVLGEVGTGSTVFTHAMNWERICLFASHVGLMERVLENSVGYARKRKQFGQAIGKFEAVSHPIADMKVQLEAARLLIYKAASGLDRSREVSLDASIVKLFISESLVHATLDAIQIHGGHGYRTENEVERTHRDAIGSTLYSGTSEMHRNIIASWLGL